MENNKENTSQVFRDKYQAKLINDKELFSFESNISFLDYEEYLKQGSWEIDLVTNIAFFSRGVYKIFECESLEKHEPLNRLIIEVIAQVSNISYNSDNSSLGHYRKEFEIIDSKGFNKRLEIFGKIINDVHTGNRKFISIIRDISTLKEYERALEIKVDELNRSNRELEEFVHIASHDLYEPLRKVSTFGERLLQNAQLELSAKNLDYLNRILNAVDRMRMLIDNLIDYSRVARGAILWDDVDLNTILEEVLARQELRIEETMASFEINKLPVVQAVPVMMIQLFDNILGNALKFKKKDITPLLKINSRQLNQEEKLKYKLFQHINYFQIDVSDNGIGFEKIYSDRIFKLFQRLNSSTEFPGSGIGLAICRKITDVHKGIIFSESKIGEGSVFSIILPQRQ